MSDKNGGPAFPPHWDPKTHPSGMALRDYFAAKAMHQFLSGAVLPVGFDASEQLAMIAARAYETADAMLAAAPSNPHSPAVPGP